MEFAATRYQKNRDAWIPIRFAEGTNRIEVTKWCVAQESNGGYYIRTVIDIDNNNGVSSGIKDMHKEILFEREEDAILFALSWSSK